MSALFEKIFPRTLAHPDAIRLFAEIDMPKDVGVESERFPDFLRQRCPPSSPFGFLAEMAEVEYACWAVGRMEQPAGKPSRGAAMNPALHIIPVTRSIAGFFSETGDDSPQIPGSDTGWILVWKGPETGRVYVEKADERLLLALKALSDDTIGLKGQELSIVNQAIDYAARKGVVLKAPYRISRTLQGFPEGKNIPKRFFTASVFTLQWHITNACDLHCKHCYDREKRSSLTEEEGVRIIEDFNCFCEEMNVRGHICFSGGNPFLSPHFRVLYERATEKGFETSILGNPVSSDALQQVIDIQTPAFFQVSLEGLTSHNDEIRGEGFYQRVMDFLDLLREKKVSSSVMLTLTKANMEEVLPLMECLRNKADYFTFNRLSQVGEGASLSLPKRDEYREFLQKYVAASAVDPVIGLKDNLINILRDREGSALFGGCTGFGCGAAFNFFALLPDGEVHACRKFPSLIGHVHKSDFLTIYTSREAERYREGSHACAGCELRPVCGGCMAVVHGMGLDPFQDKDPFCFKGHL